MAAAQNNYISIDKIAKLKGLKSNRTLRMAINNEKYKARKVPIKGGYTYEILFSSLEPEIQEKLIDEEIKSYSLVPVDNIKDVYKFLERRSLMENLNLSLIMIFLILYIIKSGSHLNR